MIKLTKADCERLRDKFLKMDAYEAEKKKSDKKSNESKTPKTPRKKPKTPKKKAELRYVVYIYINTYILQSSPRIKTNIIIIFFSHK